MHDYIMRMRARSCMSMSKVTACMYECMNE